MNAWIVLLFAGFFEILWVEFLKRSNGLTLLVPSIIAVLGGLASFFLLSRAIKVLPAAVGYATWTGIGIIGTALISTMNSEMKGQQSYFFIMVILSGIIGLYVVES